MLLLLLGLMHNVGLGRFLSSWRSVWVLTHNIGEVNPLVTSLILTAVLSGVWSCTSRDAYPLLLLLLSCTYENRWLAVSSA